MNWAIPDSWEWVKIETGYEVTSSKRVHQKDWKKSGVPFYRTRELVALSKFGFVANELYIDDIMYGQFKKAYGVPLPGDILVSGVGTIGVPYCILGHAKFYFKDGNVIWLKDRGVFDAKYTFYFYKNPALIKFLHELSSGTTVDTYTIVNAKKTPIPLPPVNEQRRIADRIDALQTKSRRAREALTEAQTLLEQFRQSVLTAAFRGDLTAKWREEHPDAKPASELLKRIRKERRKRWEEAELTKYRSKGKTPPTGWQKKYPEPVQVDTTDLPELPECWCWASLDEIAENVQYGTSEKTVDNADIPVLRMGNIVDGRLNLGSLKYLPHTAVPEDLFLQDGDILFNRTNSIELVGKSAVFRESSKATFASYLIRVSTVFVLPELISGYINSSFGRSWILSVANQQVGQANVNGKKLKALTLPIPPEAEQRQLKTILDKVQRFTDAAWQQLADATNECITLEQAILAKAFRGELVPQDPNDEPASELLERIQQKRSKTEGAPGEKKGRKPKGWRHG